MHTRAEVADRRHREVRPHGDRKLQLLRRAADTGDTTRLRRAEQRAVVQLPHGERPRVRKLGGGARREGEEQAPTGGEVAQLDAPAFVRRIGEQTAAAHLERAQWQCPRRVNGAA